MTDPAQKVGHRETLRKCTHEFGVNCSNCRLSTLCLPLSLNSDDVERLDNIIKRIDCGDFVNRHLNQ